MDLHNMFSLIRAYHDALGYPADKMDLDDRMQHFRNMSLAAFKEVAELVDSAPWKPWRAIEDQPLDRENAIREAIDTIFFLVGCLECLHVSPDDFEKKFHEILDNNYKRIRIGYNNKPEERR